MLQGKKSVIHKTPIYNLSPSSPNFGQLIKYKPWEIPQSIRGINVIFVDKWKEYLQSNQGVRNVTNWKKALEDTCNYENVSDNSANLDDEQVELEEWMYISRLANSTDSATSGNKIYFMRKEFSIDQVSLMPFWLENGKKSYFNPSFDINFVRNLNRKQT